MLKVRGVVVADLGLIQMSDWAMKEFIDDHDGEQVWCTVTTLEEEKKIQAAVEHYEHYLAEQKRLEEERPGWEAQLEGAPKLLESSGKKEKVQPK